MGHLENEQPNGQPVALPTIHIGWDAEKQIVRLAFDDKDFRTWNFIIGVLEMALQSAKDQHQFATIQQRMMAIQQQAADAMIAKKVMLGK